jgi:hypothetical protein
MGASYAQACAGSSVPMQASAVVVPDAPRPAILSTHAKDPLRLHGQHLPLADRRGRHARAAARRRPREVTAADFDDFDLLLAMDRENERELLARAPDEEARGKVRLLREFDPAAVAAGDLDVPDPYYGGPNGFEHVLDLVEAACRGLLDEVRAA